MVSIIIVNYNSGYFLNECLKSIDLYAGNNVEVIVVDNHSSDDSINKCASYFDDKKFRCIILSDNLGFAKANNVGAKESRGEILHFLNPDTKFREGMYSDYQQCRTEPSFIYINALQNLDGSYVDSKNLIPTLPNMFRRFFCGNSCDYWYTGASVIISKNNFNKIGGWNESYFMYSEDLDLFYKAQKKGLVIKKLPTIVTHVGGGSSSKVWNNYERELKVQKSFKKFYIVNGIKWQYPFVLIMSFFRILMIKPEKSFFYLKVWIDLNCLKKKTV